MNQKTINLRRRLGRRVKMNEPLSKHTFLKIGGPADLYFEADSSEEFITAIKTAREVGVGVTVIGQGSNILISDRGINGLVLVNKSKDIEILKKGKGKNYSKKIQARWESDSIRGTFKYEFKDLDYDESDCKRVSVCMDSGVILPLAVNVLINEGITGLQWYAGIPGTIGGAVFNNIHGGTHFISEVLDKVLVISKENELVEVGINELGTDYDKSRFQNSGEIIINATFKLFLGDKQKAKYVVTEWAKRKSIQPRNSPGCAFHNLTQQQKDKLNLPTTSAGYIIEHLLKMTGFKIGDAAISTKHHNFIVNEGKATASDYLAVMKEIYKRAKKEYGVELVPEIFLLGFKQDEIKELGGLNQVSIRKERGKEIKTVYKDSKKLFEATKK